MTYNKPPQTRRTARLLATLAMAALIGSGCLTIAVEAGADPGGGGGSNPANQEQAAKFSECMRTNGVEDFPDPTAQGRFAYGGISVAPTVWQKAVGACKNLQPGLFDGPGRTPEQQNAALKFAQCMRDNGVPDFPDPATAQDPLIDTSKMRGDVSAGEIPELKPAQQACRDLFNAALPGPLGTGQPG
jgi:hypothetical protein